MEVGLAVVTLGGKDHDLGKHGTPASRAESRRLVGEWLASGAVARGPEVERGLIVDDLIQRYRKHAERRYTKHGRPTSEVALIDGALGFLHDIYGHTEASSFGPLALKAVRHAMVRAKREATPKDRDEDEPKLEEPRFCRNEHVEADFEAFPFSPKNAADERRAVARANRVTPMTPSQKIEGRRRTRR